MRKAVVTGANGFVGSAVCSLLAKSGVEIIAVVRDEDEDVAGIASLPRTRLVYSDMSDYSKLAEVIAISDVDTLYHFAWAGSAGPLRGDSNVQLDNARYTCDLVRACSGMGCGRLVFASSIMEYEVQLLMGTDASPGLGTIYSSAKVAADYMARAVACSLGVDYIRAVISNIFGPGEKSPRLVNTSLRKMLLGERCSFSPGNQMYDFIYIDDAAEAFVALGDGGVANTTYYIGSERPRPLRCFLEEMRDCVDPNLEIGIGDLPFDGVSLTYEEFDIHSVERDTGWHPSVSFAEGIRKTIGWLKEVN